MEDKEDKFYNRLLELDNKVARLEVNMYNTIEDVKELSSSYKQLLDRIDYLVSIMNNTIVALDGRLNSYILENKTMRKTLYWIFGTAFTAIPTLSYIVSLFK